MCMSRMLWACIERVDYVLSMDSARVVFQLWAEQPNKIQF